MPTQPLKRPAGDKPATEGEHAAIRYMALLRQQGASLRAIAAQLREEAGISLTHAGVQKILSARSAA